MKERTLDCIYAAALDDTAMHEALLELARVCGSRSAGLFRVDRGHLDWECSTGMPEGFMETYARNYAPCDPRIRYATTVASGIVLSDAVPEVRREMEASPIADYVAGHDLHYTAGTHLLRNGDQMLALYISRSADQGPPDEETLATLSHLVPHFTRSMRLRQWNHWVQQQFQAPRPGSTLPAGGRVLVDPLGRVRWIDASAERLLAATRAIGRMQGRMGWHDPRAQHWFQHTLALATSRHRPDWSVQRLDLDLAGGTLHLALAPGGIAGDLPGPLSEPARNWLLLTLAWRPAETRLPPCLTPRQQQVLNALAEGLDTGEVATRLGCAHNTARNHAQALLRQFGVTNRIEMINQARAAGLLDI